MRRAATARRSNSPPTRSAAFAEVAQFENDGWAYIHPFDDPLVMAGQGPSGLEILDDVPQVTDVIVSIGGGGFMGGVATAVKSAEAGREGVGCRDRGRRLHVEIDRRGTRS